MNNQEFFLLLIENLWLYWGCLGLALGGYILFFRRIYISLFDPLLITLVGSVFGCSVVLFLYLSGSIKVYYLYTYLLTQGVFLGSFLFFNRFKLSFCCRFIVKDYFLFNKVIYVVASFLLILSTLGTYFRVGIPLFMNSRLDIAIDAGGWGILSRFTNVCLFFCIFYSYYFICFSEKHSFWHKYAWFTFFISIVFSALSGSKSAFVVFIIIYFFYAYSQRKSHRELLKKMRHNELWFVVVVLVSAIGVVFIRGESEIQIAVLEVVLRFVGSGDIFWMSYPNDMLEHITKNNGLLAIFSSFLSAFRLVDTSNLPIPIGIELYRFYYDVDSLMGPNARHNIFGMCYFGITGAIFFSAILGIVLGVIRSIFLNQSCNALFRIIFISYLYNIFCSLEVDINYVMGEVTSLILTLIVLLGISILIFTFLNFQKE